MNKKIAEIEQDGVWFTLWRIEGEGYTIFENGKKDKPPYHRPERGNSRGVF